jgi:hypothetical protein
MCCVLFEWVVLFCVYFRVLCLIVVPLSPGKNPLSVQLNNNNSNTNNNMREVLNSNLSCLS